MNFSPAEAGFVQRRKIDRLKNCAIYYDILGNAIMASMEVCLCLYFGAMLWALVMDVIFVVHTTK